MKVRSKRVERFARAHSPVSDPPLTWVHVLLALFVVALYFAQQYMPGLLADLGRLQVADWQFGIYARLTAFFLACWTVFGVRAMHPATLMVQVGQIVYLCIRISEIRATHEPLTATFALMLLLLSLVSIRIIVRPNEYELAQLAKEERRDL